MGHPVSGPPPRKKGDDAEAEWRRFKNAPILPPQVGGREPYEMRISVAWFFVIMACAFASGFFISQAVGP